MYLQKNKVESNYKRQTIFVKYNVILNNLFCFYFYFTVFYCMK